MLVLSILPEIHLCMREIYSWAGTSTGSLRAFNHVKEWFLDVLVNRENWNIEAFTYVLADMRGQVCALHIEVPSSSLS